MQHLWVHARRGLKEIFDSNGSPIAKAGLKRIAQLYKIEDKIRGESPATRQFVRWTESAPLVNAFGRLARRAALARLAALAPGREAHLHRQPVGRVAGVPV